MAKPAKINEDPSPFERFQKLTKDLLSVSREELQKKLNKYKKEKSKKRR